MRRAAAVAGALALLAAGCGGTSAKDVVDGTAANLGKIRSGTLTMRLMVTPQLQSSAQPFGFELHGPFTLRRGHVPQLDVSYRQVANGHDATATLVTKGDAGYVETNGRRAALTAAQLTELRVAVAGGTGAAGTAADRWVRHPKVKSSGGEYRVTGDLDAVAATTDLLALVRLSGRKVPQLTKNDRKRLSDAVRDSAFDLRTGKKDKLLRDLRLNVDFALDVPADLRRALGTLVGAKLEFRLGVDHPNGKD